jgi:hypothetical protein
MAQQHNVEVDPKYQATSEKVWSGFAVTIKYSIYVIVAVLVLMAVFLT